MTAHMAMSLPDGTQVWWDREGTVDHRDEGRIDQTSRSIVWDDGTELSFSSPKMRHVKKL